MSRNRGHGDVGRTRRRCRSQIIGEGFDDQFVIDDNGMMVLFRGRHQGDCGCLSLCPKRLPNWSRNGSHSEPSCRYGSIEVQVVLWRRVGAVLNTLWKLKMLCQASCQ